MVHPILRNKSGAGEGFALVAVLWGLAILSLVAASLITTEVFAAHIFHNRWDRIREAANLESAVARAILGITDTRLDERWRVDGTTYPVSFNCATVTVGVQDQLGLVDINAADRPLILGLVRAAGAGPSEADGIADKILDWRDGGVLQLVIGMPDAIYDQLRSTVTVYSQYNAVDPNLAPRLVLRAIPGESDADLEDTLARRSGGPASGTGDASPGKIALSVPLAGRAFGISVAAGEEERARRVEIIRLTADPTRPYLVLGRW